MFKASHTEREVAPKKKARPFGGLIAEDRRDPLATYRGRIHQSSEKQGPLKIKEFPQILKRLGLDVTKKACKAGERPPLKKRDHRKKQQGRGKGRRRVHLGSLKDKERP